MLSVLDYIMEQSASVSLFIQLIILVILVVLLRKTTQLVDYKYIVTINTLNERYEHILTTRIATINNQASDCSLQDYLLDRQPTVYHGEVTNNQLVIDKEHRQYTLSKRELEPFFFALSQIKTVIQSKSPHRRPYLMLEMQNPLLLVSLIDKNQWDQLEHVFTRKQLAPVVYLAVRQVELAWDQLLVTDQLYVRDVFKDYGRSGMEKLAVYLTRRERRVLKALEKKIRTN
ncbi:hypothetical protein SAMN05421839_11915 [Halolactibacillus halophilus]|uniref:Uncharacterized protein n=1 Tax=Halolactibacillus halophilus TaxID=306540 RepID=A0A1I5Q7G3_9BACI|nr:hypothetical protein HHA03_11590 [Halolactibacillus halophilus]SFP41951.1 hypothetical protein SAMN05421839_11915 [Halolactibacillus halophilus]